MNRFLLTALSGLFLAPSGFAIVDTNNNGLSDLWEKAQNNGELFSESLDPQADSDSDGWTNAQEATAGTNPFDPNPPDGLIRPEIALIPAVLGEPDENGIPVPVSPESVTITWPTLVGKQYTLRFSPDLSEGSWIPVGEPFIAYGGVSEYDFYEVSAADKCFWRVSVGDVDSDSDGLNNYEEHLTGTDPTISDSDGDTLSDSAELIEGTDPLQADADGDGWTDPQEIAAGTDSRNQDTDGDGIPDSIDSDPLVSALAFADADGDGIPDADDAAPDNSRGPAPFIAAENASGNPLSNLIKDETAKFVLTVSNPAGDAPTASSLTFFLNGTEETESATITAIGSPVASSQRFLLTWTAKTTANYPAHTLQNLTLRFRDSAEATSWLKLARIDVAEWEGMIAGLAIRYNNIHTRTFSIGGHANGLQIPTSPWCGAYGNGPRWYRGPSIIPYHGRESHEELPAETRGTLSIGQNMRYPLFIIDDTDSSAPAVTVRDISDPVQYPHGFWGLNQWSGQIKMEGAGTPHILAPGTTMFYQIPQPLAEDAPYVFQAKYLTSGTWQSALNNIWPVPARTSSRQVSALTAATRDTGTTPVVLDWGFSVPVEARIVSSAAGTLEHPGLPMAYLLEQAPLCIGTNQWHRVVVKVGPDAAVVARGVRLRLNSGSHGTDAAQAGIEFRRKTATGFETYSPGEILEGSAEYKDLTGPNGLVLFVKFSHTADQLHRLSLDLLPNGSTLEPFEIRNLELLPVDLAVDTDRNGIVSPGSDQVGEDQWTDQLGAIYGVNFDRDGDINHNSKPAADAITWWDTEGVPFNEDWKINGQSDESDISPLVITIPNLPDGSKAYLVAGEAEDFRAIHLFSRIKADKQVIWGGFLDAGKPWTDNDSNPLDIEITQWLNASADDPTSTATGIKEGTYTFGIEGLLFRGMKVPGGTLPEGAGKFSGLIDLELELAIPGNTERLKCGKVRMKVAPFLLTLNDRPTDHVYVMDTPGGLQSIPKSLPVASGAPSQWLQDHAEIGYTQRPGGPVMKIAFVCPREGQLAEWPRTLLLAPGKGVFALGQNLGGSGGDYGGNIELSHPQEGYPIGRILAGSTMGAKLELFLEAQEKQKPIIADISYTEVKHIDEVLSPGSEKATYIADPAGAVALLREKFTTIPQKLQGVLFAEDEEKAMMTSIFATTFSPQNHYLITSLDYDSQHTAWESYVGGYLRLVTPGTSGGQVARISAISRAVAADNSVNVVGKLKLEVSMVWDTTQTNAAPARRASQKWNSQNGNERTDWHKVPVQGSYVVAVKKTKFWRNGCPAIITVGEVLQDSDFLAYNETTLPPLIQATATAMGVTNPVKIPSLFYQNPAPPNGAVYSSAYSPNTANLQWVDSNPVNAKPYGPRDDSNTDVLKARIASSLLGTSSFVDDWHVFHIKMGEVHCGSNAERQAEEKWWTKK